MTIVMFPPCCCSSMQVRGERWEVGGAQSPYYNGKLQSSEVTGRARQSLAWPDTVLSCHSPLHSSLYFTIQNTLRPPLLVPIHHQYLLILLSVSAVCVCVCVCVSGPGLECAVLDPRAPCRRTLVTITRRERAGYSVSDTVLLTIALDQHPHVSVSSLYFT